MRKIPPDEMDASRAARQRADDDMLEVAMQMLPCPCCGDKATIERTVGTMFPWHIACTARVCGIRTPAVRGPWIALGIWNRRYRRGPLHASGKRGR